MILALAACTDERPLLEEQPRDSAALALQEARLRELLEKQAAEFALRAAEDRRLREPVTVERATVVLFYPGLGPPTDSHPIHALLTGAADTASAAGWAFADRLGMTLQIIDSSARAIYKSPVARDSFGVALVVPGYPPRVRYGLVAILELGAHLRALEAWRAGGPGSAPAAAEHRVA